VTAGELAGPVLWAGACHLAMWTAGSWLRPRLFRVPPGSEPPVQGAFLSGMLGFAMLGGATVVLATLRLLYAPLLAALVVALAAAGAWKIVRAPRRRVRSLALTDLPAALAILVVVLHLPGALYPVLENDESVYHLLLPKLYLASRGFVALPWNLYANMPHLVDLSYVMPGALGEFTAAKVFVLGFAVWTMAGLSPLARELLGPAGPGILALLYVSGANVRWHMGLAYVEPVIGALLLGAVLSLRSWWGDRGEPGHLRTLGVLAGAACASKYTVWPHAAALFAVVALTPSPVERRWPPRGLATVLGAGAILVVPWLVKGAVVTGNPIYPNAYGLLGGAHWSAIQDVQFHNYLASAGGAVKSWRSTLLLPVNLVVRPFLAFGSASFSAAVMVLALASMARPWRRDDFATPLRLLVLAGFAAWAAGSQQGRFLVAWVPVIVASAAVALAPLRDRRGALTATAVAIVAAGLGQAILQPDVRRPAFEVFSVTRRDLLARNYSWDLTEFLNRTVPAGEGVLAMWENQLYFLDRPFIADSVFEAPTILAGLRAAGDPDAFARQLAAAGITHVVVNPLPYGNYTRNRFPEPILDDRVYPADRLEADRKLLDRFLVTHLERIPWDGRWSVFRLRESARPSD
jgi:hypothetical protein